MTAARPERPNRSLRPRHLRLPTWRRRPTPRRCPPTPTPEADTTVSPTVTPAGQDAGQAQQTYPLLPLTVVPKPDASPLALLKAPHEFTQRLAIVALLLTILSAVTLVLWRYHRRDYASPRRTGRRI